MSKQDAHRTIKDHCMHVHSSMRQRYCCWCSLNQHQVYAQPPAHGPRFSGERYIWHWEPSSMQGDCPHDAVDELAEKTV